jgi:hypothetical protein
MNKLYGSFSVIPRSFKQLRCNRNDQAAGQSIVNVHYIWLLGLLRRILGAICQIES